MVGVGVAMPYFLGGWKSEQNVSERRRREARTALLATVPESQMIIFGPRDGSFVELQPQPRMRSVTIYNPTGIVAALGELLTSTWPASPSAKGSAWMAPFS